MKIFLIPLLLLTHSLCAIASEDKPIWLELDSKITSPQITEAENDALNNMAFYALSLSGTPYQYGGNSPETGFDCSGFVGHVFKYSLGLTLPRSTAEMWQWGHEINIAELHPGDLVFYDTLRRRFSHVGIYLGDNRFVHSPSSGGGIRVEKMSDDYWQRNFNGARRITLPR